MGKFKNQILAALERAPIRQAMILPRRKFLIGAVTLLAAPAIVRYESLMQVKPVRPVADGIRGWVDEFHIIKTGGEHILSFWSNQAGAWQYVSWTMVKAPQSAQSAK